MLRTNRMLRFGPVLLVAAPSTMSELARTGSTAKFRKQVQTWADDIGQYVGWLWQGGVGEETGPLTAGVPVCR
jgi:hypothetical protein